MTDKPEYMARIRREYASLAAAGIESRQVAHFSATAQSIAYASAPSVGHSFVIVRSQFQAVALRLVMVDPELRVLLHQHVSNALH